MSPATFAALIELQRMRARFANCAEHSGSDAEFINRCCANYDALVAALGELLEADRSYDNVRSGVEATAWEVMQATERRAAALARIGGAA